MENYISTFIFFFAVIDPIGTVPVFIAVTKNYQKKEKNKIALKAVLVSALILIFFIIAGEIILEAIQVPLSAFQIAGGIIVFLFALTMVFGESKPEEEIKMMKDLNEIAIFPIATPSIASPGAMLAAVLLTKNAEYGPLEQLYTTLIMLIVLLIVYVLMIVSTKLHNLIGNNGASIISRIMGLILASVAASNVLAGIKDYFEI